MTLVDNRTNLAKDVIGAIRENYGLSMRIFDTEIPMAVKTAEASKSGQSIFSYEPASKVAKAYEELTKEVMSIGERNKQRHEAAVAR